jgi:hypothetical protein
MMGKKIVSTALVFTVVACPVVTVGHSPQRMMKRRRNLRVGGYGNEQTERF